MAEIFLYDNSRARRWPISAESNAVHVYDQILSFLRDKSTATDKTLPSEYELIHYFGVHRNALRSALRQLDTIGLVERKRGKGTFRHQTPRSHAVISSAGLSRGLSKDWGSEVSRRVLAMQSTESSPYLAEQFKVRVGTPLRVVERLTLFGDEPLGIWSYYLPEELAQSLHEEDFCSDADTFIKKTGDHSDPVVSFSVSAESAGEEIAQTLEVTPGSLLLHLERRCVDAQNNVLLIAYGRLRNDRFVLEMSRGYGSLA